MAIREQCLLFLCMIHLCFAREIFEAVPTIETATRTYVLSNYGNITNIRFPVPCKGLSSIFLTGILNDSIHAVHIQVCPTASCKTAGYEYVKVNGTDKFTDDINWDTPIDILWLNRTASGVIAFGIQRPGFVTNMPPFDQIDDVEIKVASDICTSWTLEKSICSNGTHGYSCELPCGHCLGVACARYTGDCPNGCEVGWTGINCMEEILNVSQSPHTAKVLGGSTTTITCTLAGQPTVNNVTWLFTPSGGTQKTLTVTNRHSGAQPTNPSLTISSFQHSDEGTYVCHVSNDDGQATSATTTVLTYMELLTLTISPSDPVNIVGDPFRQITCSISGTPQAFSVSWYRRHISAGTLTQITSSSKYIFASSFTSPNLTLINIEESDEQDYFCIANNTAGTVTSSRSRLTVNEDPCSNHTCFNEGVCFNNNSDAACNCTAKYTGKHCQIYVSPCNAPTCLNGGICYDNFSNAVCICTTMYTGPWCEIYRHPCSAWVCENGGLCDDTNTNASCTCPQEFTGSHCENSIDPCLQWDCHNKGVCHVNNSGNATCQCTRRFTGPNCEQYIDPCLSSPCQHEGKCVDRDGNVTCLCNGHYKGAHCESPVTTVESLSHKIDKTSLSSYKRKRTSASDTRRSAMYLGVGGVSLITIVVLLIVSLDCLPNPRKK